MTQLYEAATQCEVREMHTVANGTHNVSPAALLDFFCLLESTLTMRCFSFFRILGFTAGVRIERQLTTSSNRWKGSEDEGTVVFF